VAPVVEGSSPFTHPKAPVAQLDRASDFESAGRPFESDRARHAPCKVRGCRVPYRVHGTQKCTKDNAGRRGQLENEPLAQ
jgi:hypothetical protein